ncbi:MAG: PD40 domain-containing protein [Bradymonadaceae bacterium]|nr:PD40 domain-containing protein [Lujinxingiaceae bacterium]
MLWAPADALAIDDPALDYFTLTTPHFYVHYYSGLEELAKRTAIAAEEAHAILSPLMDWKPVNRTHINVTDKLDTANGSAGVFMRNKITIYGMAPPPDSVLGNYDDWLRILVYHEYVHILHLDTNPGLSQFINLFIGKQMHPNQVLPRWYTEGIATFYESARTGTGRINSALFQMWVRTAALEDRLFTLGQSSGLPIQWPSGSAAYLYGGFFMDYVARRHGEDFIRDFNHIYGSRIIPFSLNQSARQISGQSFDELWQEWTAEALAIAQAQRIAVKAAGETSLDHITHKGGRQGNPVVRPGRNQVSFYRADQVSKEAYVAASSTGQRVEELFDIDSAAGPAAWTPDGDTLIYTQATITRGVYAYQDLFAWHAPTNATRQLTSAERAREPAVSPDGTKLAYVRNLNGTMELVWRAFDDLGVAHVLISGTEHPGSDDAHWQQISMPTFSPDGSALVFSWWRLDARQRDLWMITLEGEGDQRLRRLTSGASHEMDPAFGPDGMLYFSSDHSGIFNIYAMDLESEDVWQVSNVINGVFTPRLSEDGHWLWVTSYTADGFEIARFRRPTRLRHKVTLNREAPSRIVYPPADPSLDLEAGPYQPWRWLLPLSFMPDFGLLASGVGASATITGEDPVGNHSYSIGAGWTSGPEFTDRQANLGASYRFGGWPFNLGLTARMANLPRTRGLIAESRHVPYAERQYLGRATLSYPLRFVSHNFSFNTSLKLEHTSMHERPLVEHEPGDIRPQEPQKGWYNEVSFGLSYGHTDRYPLSVTTEKGVAASASLSFQNTTLGSLQDLTTLIYGFDAYHSNPLVERHVFALQLRGAITGSGVGASRQFTIGGQTPQDVLSSIIFQEPRLGFALRGYPPAVMRGSQYQVLKLEYRFPLIDIDQGFSTLPLFFRQLKGSLFADAGAAYNGFFADASFRRSFGAEIQLDALLGYHIFNTLRLGHARGIDDEGIAEWYLLFGGGY